MADSATVVRVRDLHDEGDDDHYATLTPAQRLGMMWQLALDTWAFNGLENAESQFSRHFVRVQRRGR